MKVKKFSQLLVGSMLLMMLFSITANAATVVLFKHSSNTYVTSSHPDGYFADTYTGVASVIGTDRKSDASKTYSFAWTEIRYNVQGTVTSGRASSTSSSDNIKRTKTIKVKDLWNNGPKTKASYNYQLRLFSNVF